VTEGRRELRERRRWERRMQRQLRALDKVAGRAKPARQRRRIGPVVPGLLISGLIAAVAMLHSPNVTGYRMHQLLDSITHHGHGEYSFILTAPDGEPVSWDHCKSIHYVVNPVGAPDGWETTVRDAVDDVGEQSGFVFQYDGTSSDRTFEDRLSEGTPSDPPPVLIAWATSEEVPELAGETAGIGGSTPVGIGSRLEFVTGMVVLDKDAYDQMESSGRGQAEQLILEHELGHVLGLDHVKDPAELMNAEYLGQTGLGPGDIEGLKKLDALPCS
jgi:Matrixin